MLTLFLGLLNYPFSFRDLVNPNKHHCVSDLVRVVPNYEDLLVLLVFIVLLLTSFKVRTVCEHLE